MQWVELDCEYIYLIIHTYIITYFHFIHIIIHISILGCITHNTYIYYTSEFTILYNIYHITYLLLHCRYACYLVFFSKAVPNHDCLEIPMFFGFVGLVDALLLLPLLAFWHYTGIEEFELPPTSNIWTLLLINGFIGTVLSELLWLWYIYINCI